ncbi:MAG: hypothetical protein HDT28_02200 [Clostridiales bacterium]|nr:hypothetical protein [Clostridiales bacterium]
MITGRILNKIINIFTGLFGIATLVLMLIVYLNNLAGIIPSDIAIKIGAARNYCTLATVFCAGVEFTLKRNIIFAIVFACIIVAVAAFMIYTDVAI